MRDRRRFALAARALANPSIFRVQLAWTGCITAEMAQTVGLAVVAYRATGIYGVATLGLVRSLPAAVLGPFTAAVADRWSRRRVLVGVLLLRAALLACAALVVASSLPSWALFAVAAVDAVVYSVWWPTQSALLPELATSANEATAANVLTTVIENLGGLLGPLLGAALVSAFAPSAVFAVGSAVLAASAVVVLPLASTHREPATPSPDTKREAGREGDDDGHLLSGFGAAFGPPHPRTVMSLYLLQTFTLGMVGVLVVAVALEVLDLGEAGIGLLTSAMGAGGMAGAAATVALVGRRRLGTTLGLALVGWGAALAFAGVVPILPVVLLLLAGVGVGNAFVDVAALTLLQRTVRDSMLVRVLGVFEGLWWAALGFGALAGAALSDLLGVRSALVATGALLATAALVCGRELRRIDGDAGPPAFVLGALQGVPFLDSLPPVALERLAFAAEVSTVHARTVLITRGGTGDRFYVLAEGEVEVVAPEGTRRLGPGSHFGEVALLHDVVRTAQVTATTDGTVVTLDRETFLEALALDPSTHASAARHSAHLARH